VGATNILKTHNFQMNFTDIKVGKEEKTKKNEFSGNFSEN